MFDLESLVTPVTDDQPCGIDVKYTDDFREMEKAKGENEKQMGEKIVAAIPANWYLVREKALNLFSVTRDLRVAVHLVLAFTHIDGLKGFVTTLPLIAELLNKYWPCLHPELDTDDSSAMARRNSLRGLSYFAFIDSLSKKPLLVLPPFGELSLFEIQVALSLQDSTVEAEQKRYRFVESFFQAVDITTLKEALQLIESCKQTSLLIVEVFDQHVKNDEQLDLDRLIELLDWGIRLLSVRIAAKTPPTEPMQSNKDVIDEPLEPTNSLLITPLINTTAAIQNHQQVIQILEQLCTYYAQHEPSSPIPLLLKRAQRLVGKDFMSVLHDLHPDGVNQLEQLFGIKE